MQHCKYWHRKQYPFYDINHYCSLHIRRRRGVALQCCDTQMIRSNFLKTDITPINNTVLWHGNTVHRSVILDLWLEIAESLEKQVANLSLQNLTIASLVFNFSELRNTKQTATTLYFHLSLEYPFLCLIIWNTWNRYVGHTMYPSVFLYPMFVVVLVPTNILWVTRELCSRWGP